MPHQCTNCGRTFADGSKEMLSGCPDCSGTKFQFRPDGFDGESTAFGTDGPGKSVTGDTSADPDESVGSSGETVDQSTRESSDGRDPVSRTVGSAAATVRDLVGGSTGPDATAAAPRSDDGADDDIIVAESEPIEESDAQTDARSQLAGPDEVPDAVEPGGESASTGPTPEDGTESGSTGPASDDRSVAEEPDAERADRPDLTELREELNEQFESIRVVEPGQYELNLMELYDREEYIIALQEDGRYSIQVPETWREADV